MSITQVRVAVVGYGNVGRAVALALQQNSDTELIAILSRSPKRVSEELSKSPALKSANVQVAAIDDEQILSKIDVAILCGGSKDDLPKQGPLFASKIHTVDSYDNHSKIPEYFAAVDVVAKKHGKVSVISAGWDPGTFSLERVVANAIIPDAKTYGFYGVSPQGGLSMGHSDALRTIDGVKDARQYTHAIPEAIEKVRRGENPTLTPGDMHWRECFIVLEDGADAKKIEQAIVTMPGYFAPYKTTIHFITEKELHEKYSGMPHDGLVIGAGKLGGGEMAVVEYRNTWQSNAAGTAHILVAHTRAAYRLAKEGRSGAFTILDIPPAYLSPKSRDELLKDFV